MSWTTEKTRDFTSALESGTLNGYGVPTDNPARVRTSDFLTIVTSSCEVQFDNQNLYCNVFQYDVVTESFVTSSGWKKGNYSFTLSTSRKVKVIFSKNAGGTTVMDVSDVTGFSIHADFGDIQWSQDDGKNFGYPFPTNAGTIPEFNGTNSFWEVIPSILWGYPHIKGLYTRKYQTVDGRYIRRPLMVYNRFQLDFSKNGYQVLHPIKAEHSLEFGTFGEIVVEHPIDKAGAWKALRPNEIILAPCDWRGKDNPQPFRIYRLVTQMSSNGEKTVTAYARHILYDMNEVMMEDVRPTDKNGMDAIAWLFSHPFDRGFVHKPTDYIQFYSDIDTVTSAEYQRISLTNALIGADNSILNRWGGELYGSGLYFSICRKMEFSRENAFKIRYSVEMVEVSEDLDYTDYCTYIHAMDNFGFWVDWSFTWEDPIPHPRIVTFSYSSIGEGYWSLGGDAMRYWQGISRPKVSYTFKFVQLHSHQDYDGLQTCEVGDTGQIYNPELDIDTVQRITYKRIDLITGDTLEVRTGEQRNFVGKSAWSDTVSSGAPSAIEKQLEAETLSNLTTWGSAQKYVWSQVKKYTWGQAGET